MGKNESILIIEDEPSIADNLSLSLSREGYDVSLCVNLTDGREYFNENNYDCMILDVGLPDGNGFDFCREVRSQSDIPIIMLTARSDEIDRVVGLEIGADDYITKPFSPRELVARVRAVLRRTQREIKINPVPDSKIKVDEDTFEVYVEGKLMQLSHHEFRLIAVLAKSPGRIFSRQQLLEKAWDDPQAAMERTVDAHIKGLRSKIREISGRDLIQTHRGFGYSMIVENN